MTTKWIVTGLLITAAGGYVYADYTTDRNLADNLNKVNQELARAGQGQLQYDDADVSLLSQNITLTGLNFIPAEPDRPGILVEKMLIRGFELGQRTVPHNLRIDMENIELRLSDLDTLLAEADALTRTLVEDNFDVRDNTLHLYYDAEMGYDYDMAASTLDAFSHYHSAEMMASDIDLQIINLPRLEQPLETMTPEAIQEQQSDMMMQLFNNAGLTRLQFAYRDQGLMQKLYQSALADPELVAAMEAQGFEPNVDNLKQTLISALDQSMQGQQRDVSRLEQELLGHLRQFLASDNPQLNITLSSVKPEGLKFSDFLILMMSNGHPEIAKSLVDIKISSQ